MWLFNLFARSNLRWVRDLATVELYGDWIFYYVCDFEVHREYLNWC